MSALCCRAGDSPLVAASRVTLSVQLYAELGALGLVSAMLAVARPHPDERSGLAITALWLAVATGSLALGACVASLRGLRRGSSMRMVAAVAVPMAKQFWGHNQRTNANNNLPR